MSVEQDLLKETKKWLSRAKKRRSEIKSSSPYLKNIDSYLKDTEHFMKKGDLIRAFEAIVWAWSWIEILEELKVIET